MTIRASLLCLPLFSLSLTSWGRTALADTPPAPRPGSGASAASPKGTSETPKATAQPTSAPPTPAEAAPAESTAGASTAEPAPSTPPSTAAPAAEAPRGDTSTGPEGVATGPEATPLPEASEPPALPPSAAPISRTSEVPAAEAAPSGPRKGNEGHFILGGSAGFTAPFGELAQGLEAFPTIDMGFAAALDAGYGLSEHLVLGAQGELDFHGDASACEDCSARSIFAGAFARYHLVSHLRFDPWVSYGLGFRTLGLETGAGDSQSFHGLEWLRIQFGGDFYLTKTLGFGPVVQLSAMSFLKSPYDNGSSDDPNTGGVNWRFSTGFRIVLDHPGH